MSKIEDEHSETLANCKVYLRNNRIYLPDTLASELQYILDRSLNLDARLGTCRVLSQLPEPHPELLEFEIKRAKLPLEKINLKDRNAPVIFIQALCDELDRLSERLEKLYKSVADTTPS